MSNIGIASNKKLIDLYNKIKDGTLILAPDFQRKLVWNNSHKEKFIETILSGLPFPEIYLADGEIDLESQTSKTLVVDGQQRLSTIYQYITGHKEFTIKNIEPFANLSAAEKTSFFDYVIVVRDLGRIEKKKILDIFNRINSIQYALNSVEIQNSLYQGEFITTAKEILANHQIFERIDLFNETQSSRMLDLEYILLIMSTIEEGGYFSRDKEVEEYVTRYDNEYPNKNKMLDILTKVFDLIVQCNIASDSLWNKKSSFFNLIIELVNLYVKYNNLPNSNELKNMLLNLEEKLQNSKNENRYQDKFAEYYYYIYQGSTGKKARDVRGQLLKEYLEKLISCSVPNVLNR